MSRATRRSSALSTPAAPSSAMPSEQTLTPAQKAARTRAANKAAKAKAAVTQAAQAAAAATTGAVASPASGGAQLDASMPAKTRKRRGQTISEQQRPAAAGAVPAMNGHGAPKRPGPNPRIPTLSIDSDEEENSIASAGGISIENGNDKGKHVDEIEASESEPDDSMKSSFEDGVVEDEENDHDLQALVKQPARLRQAIALERPIWVAPPSDTDSDMSASQIPASGPHLQVQSAAVAAAAPRSIPAVSGQVVLMGKIPNGQVGLGSAHRPVFGQDTDICAQLGLPPYHDNRTIEKHFMNPQSTDVIVGTASVRSAEFQEAPSNQPPSPAVTHVLQQPTFIDPNLPTVPINEAHPPLRVAQPSFVQPPLVQPPLVQSPRAQPPTPIVVAPAAISAPNNVPGDTMPVAGSGPAFSQEDAEFNFGQPLSTWIVIPHGPGGSRLRLHPQSQLIRALLGDVINLTLGRIVLEDAFPDNVTKTRHIHEDLFKAARERTGCEEILQRLSVDIVYKNYLSTVPEGRISSFRGRLMKSVQSALPGFYGLTAGCSDVVGRLRNDYTYIFKSLASGVAHRAKPYQHAIFPSQIQEHFFTTTSHANGSSFAERNVTSFQSTHPDYADAKEIPAPMLALVATVVYAGLCEWTTGQHKKVEFSANTYIDAYAGHIATLQDIRMRKPLSYHNLMSSIYNAATGSSTQAPSAATSAISVIDINNMDDDIA